MTIGCKLPLYGYDPCDKTKRIIIGCNCEKGCVYRHTRTRMMSKHKTDDGYRSNMLQFSNNCISNKDYYFDKNLCIKGGYIGVKDCNNDNKIHMIFGTIAFAHRYPVYQPEWSIMTPPMGDNPLYFWLEDEDGNIFDHVDPIGYRIAKKSGADVSKIDCYQRFKGVSKKDLFDKFGLWYLEEKSI